MSLIPEEFYQEIKTSFPSIQKEDIKIFDDGWDYLVCAVHNKEVFRFPRRDDYVQTLPREVKFLHVFFTQSTIPVPQMSLYHLSTGRPYTRYPFLIGNPFELAVAKHLKAEELTTIAKQLGTFLSSLHSLPIDQAKTLGFEAGNLNEMWKENFTKTQNMVYPLIDTEEQQWITDLFNNYFNILDSSHVPQRLTHGDMISRHILFDNQIKKLSGIIDFGDMLIGDPAFDFAYLGNYGRDFLNTVYNNYLVEKDAAFDKRRQFYESRWMVAEIEHAIALQNQEDIKRFKEQLSEYIKNHPAIG